MLLLQIYVDSLDLPGRVFQDVMDPHNKDGVRRLDAGLETDRNVLSLSPCSLMALLLPRLSKLPSSLSL